MRRELTTVGFLAAGLYNVVGILWVSRFFTNTVLFDAEPDLFGPRGCVLVVIWGLAYVSVATRSADVPGLCGVFAVEKAFYTVAWLQGLQQHVLSDVFDADALTGFFLATYGAGDALFGVFFAWVAWRSVRRRRAPPPPVDLHEGPHVRLDTHGCCDDLVAGRCGMGPSGGLTFAELWSVSSA